MQFATANNYRMAVSNSNWKFQYSTYPADWNSDSFYHYVLDGDWQDPSAAQSIITEVQGLYGGQAGFHSYYLVDDADQLNQSQWKAIEIASEQIHTHDSPRKAYVSTGVPSPDFISLTPSLDIIQVDIYPFTSYYPDQIYWEQQTCLDYYLIPPQNDVMNLLKGQTTEWQAIIQAHEDIRPSGAYLRRPNFL